MVFRRRQKAALVAVADGLLIIGLAVLVPTMCSAVLLILDVVLGRGPAIVGAALTALVALLTWYVLPVAVRRTAPVAPPQVRGDGVPPGVRVARGGRGRARSSART